jgi:quinol-cytochrome oxidoreductase complex cytochrome b subunit
MNRTPRNDRPLRQIRTSLFSTRSRLGAWLLDIGGYRVSPAYRGLHWLSAAALVLLLFEVVTGILLALYYYPEPDAAYASTRFLNERVPAGWFIRGVHTWSGELLLAVVFLHVAFAYFRRAYEHPRQYEWLAGALLLPAVLAFRFTGRLLPWDTFGHEVTRRGLDLIEQVPILGSLTATWLRGGDAMGPNTLSRFFATHTLVLPWLVLGFLVLHLYLLSRHSLKEPEA